MKTAFFLLLSLLPCVAAAQSVAIRCTGWVGNTRNVITVRMTTDGRIVPWSRQRLVKASKKSLFEALTKPATGYRSVRSFKSFNGYSLLRITAKDAQITLGIAPNRKTGYFNYSDRTTGRGDLTVTLMCREARLEGQDL